MSKGADTSNYAALRGIVKKIPGIHVTVAGDLILDVYLTGDVKRISPEAPVPVLERSTETCYPGGAANVALNLKGLGVNVLLAGVLGDDAAGKEFLSLIRSHGIDSSCIISEENYHTTKKTRIIARSQQLLRIDYETRKNCSQKLTDELAARISNTINKSQALIYSDYGKGVLHETSFQKISAIASRQGVFTAVDPKLSNYAIYHDVHVMTPNHIEAGEIIQREVSDDNEIREAGYEIIKKYNLRELVITRGARGMTVFSENKGAVMLPAYARSVYDVSGAGDTVIAVYTAARVAGACPIDAAHLANHAAGIVISKFGTAAITQDELIHELSSPA